MFSTVFLPLFSNSGPFTQFFFLKIDSSFINLTPKSFTLFLFSGSKCFRLMPPFNFIDGEKEFDLKGFSPLSLSLHFDCTKRLTFYFSVVNVIITIKMEA